MKKLESQEQETECNDDDPVRVLKYCFIFALAYAALLAVIQFLPIEGGSGVNIGVLLGAVTAAVTVFVQDNERVPSKAERCRMTQGSLFFSFVVSFVASYILLSVNGLDPLALLTEWVDFVSPSLFGAAIIFMTLIY